MRRSNKASALKLKPQVELTAPRGFRNRRALTLAIESAWRNLPRKLRSPFEKKYEEVSVSVTLITPGKMKKLNHHTRGKDRPTDVLAFSQLEGALPPTGMLHLGDIVLCPDVAKEQAARYGASVPEEMQRLTVHGFLHLLGYDHEKSPAEARRMFRLQNQILRQL